MNVALREAALGRWGGILPALGLPLARLNGKHGPCPICDGKDRFRFDDKEGRGTWICNQCGAGDGISLVMQMHGLDFKGAAARIEPLLGVSPALPRRREPSDADCRRWRNEAWLGARPVTLEDPAGLFLRARADVMRFPTSLRCHPDLEHRAKDGRVSRHPCMLAMVTGPDGKPVNIHRTYLTLDGQKADVDYPRLMMPGLVPEGSAIRLSEPTVELGIAEGIETAFAAAALHGIPCWSAVNATMLAKWKPPAGVKKVTVFADNDASFTGQHAAFQLANRIVVRDHLTADVAIPDHVGTDWNDVYLARRRSA